MKVNPNPILPAAAEPAPPTQKPGAPPAATTASDFTASTQLTDQLAATPAVRAAEVARARTLIADPNYPDSKTINAVARHLAENLPPPTDPAQS